MFWPLLAIFACAPERADADLDDADGDGFTVARGDCADNDPSRGPGAPEVCDGDDDDCDGLVDDGVKITGFADEDGDGYGVDSPTSTGCTIHPGYAAENGDCDDANPAVNPGAPEVCDGGDQDCDRLVDDADPDLDPTSAATFYADSDGDGYGSEPVLACQQPAGTSIHDGDCNDANTAFNPAAGESCTEATDFNCDGFVGYADNDGDGFAACVECDDGDAAVRPDATELCNEVDDDCDGAADDEDDSLELSTAPVWYRDSDGDGYGDEPTSACRTPAGYAATGGDCADDDATIRPGAAETCNATDDDCDGNADDADEGLDLSTATEWHADADGDAYGSSPVLATSCSPPLGAVSDAADCDDSDANVNPSAREACNDVDDDCDGAVDSGTGIWNDTFDDNDITDWTVVDGGWSVSSGVVLGYSISHVGPDFLHSTSMTGREDTYVMNLRAAGNHDFGLVLAYASSTESCGFHFLQGQDIYLVRGSGDETTVGTVSYDPSVFYDVRAELSPENVDLYFDGALVFSGDAGCDDFYRTGEIGLQVHQDQIAYFDEVCVEW